MLSILYSYAYNAIRVYSPAGTYLKTGDTQRDESEKYFQEAMPFVHFFAILLTAGQAIFYLQLEKKTAKFLSLFWVVIIDISAFMLIYFLAIGAQTILLHVLGATFDTGGNFD